MPATAEGDAIGLLHPVTHQLNIGSHQGIQAAYHTQKQQTQLALLTARLQPAALKAGAMPPRNVAQLVFRKPQLCSGLQAGIGHEPGIGWGRLKRTCRKQSLRSIEADTQILEIFEQMPSSRGAGHLAATHVRADAAFRLDELDSAEGKVRHPLELINTEAAHPVAGGWRGRELQMLGTSQEWKSAGARSRPI